MRLYPSRNGSKAKNEDPNEWQRLVNEFRKISSNSEGVIKMFDEELEGSGKQLIPIVLREKMLQIVSQSIPDTQSMMTRRMNVLKNDLDNSGNVKYRTVESLCKAIDSVLAGIRTDMLDPSKKTKDKVPSLTLLLRNLPNLEKEKLK